MKSRYSMLTLAAMLICAAPGAHAATVYIDGSSNIFGAGHAAPPAPSGGGAGILPTLFAFPAAPAQVLTFSSVTGAVTCCSSTFNGPDGGVEASGTTDILSYGGVAGVKDDSHTMFLVGVFLGSNEPVDPAPARLDFSVGALGEHFASLAPAIGQVFYVGDGLTGTGGGATQQFLVPSTATRLYLGFADAFDFGSPTGLPGFYGDNSGTILAILDVSGLPTPTRARSWGTLKVRYR